MNRTVALVFGLVTALASTAAAQDQTTTAESAVLEALNACWHGEDGSDVRQEARRIDYTLMPGARGNYFYRALGDRVVTFSADYGPDAQGRPEPACRVTVLVPQLDTPWSRRLPILSNPDLLLDVMIDGAERMTPPYRVVSRRAPHPSRPGARRTLLKAYEGDRGRMIYIEESPDAFEVLYVHAVRSTIDDPSIPDIGTDPVGRVGAQAFVDDRWTIAFCELNPHACSEPESARASSSVTQNWTLPFSGIGSSGGDNRSAQQRSRDESWWRNYHETGRGRYD
jgi:hypothetical protein